MATAFFPPQLCKRWPGFMRVALAEPQPDKNFQRHGWVTFDRTVNIKEICWNLSSIRVSYHFELIATVSLMWEFRFQSDFRLFALHKTPFSDFLCIEKHIFSDFSDYFSQTISHPCHLLRPQSSVESQKGTIAIQRCSVENQKGAIARLCTAIIGPFWFSK